METSTAASAVTNQAGGHESEVLAGFRGELRAKRFGYFADAQLGFVRWGKVIQGVTFTPPSTVSFSEGPRTRVAASLGAGAEYAPTKRVHVRGELASLLQDAGGGWTNSLQPTVGVYYGIGDAICWMPPTVYEARPHRFFDWKNMAALGVGELGTTADTVTTYEFTNRGYTEGDPVVRPLVKYGLPGDLALQGIEVGLELAGMYGFHRLHQHWAERAVPLAIGTAHGILAYQNTQIYSRSRYANADRR